MQLAVAVHHPHLSQACSGRGRHLSFRMNTNRSAFIIPVVSSFRNSPRNGAGSDQILTTDNIAASIVGHLLGEQVFIPSVLSNHGNNGVGYGTYRNVGKSVVLLSETEHALGGAYWSTKC